MTAALVLLLSAASPSLQLDWRGDPQCPSREAFLADVRRLRGDVREASGDAAVAVEVTLEPVAAQWRARVATRSRGGQGRRELEAGTCAEAVAAAAVVVSLALGEPEAALVEVQQPRAPPASASPFSLGLTGGVRVGPLPVAAPGASLVASLALGGFRLEAGVTTPFLVHVSTAGAEAELAWWLSARVTGCAEFPLGRVTLAPCLSASGGWLAGRGVGGQATSSGSGALVAVSAGGLARLRLFSALWLRLDGAGGAALARPRFVTVTDDVKSVVAESAPWLFDANLGLEWRFDERR